MADGDIFGINPEIISKWIEQYKEGHKCNDEIAIDAYVDKFGGL